MGEELRLSNSVSIPLVLVPSGKSAHKTGPPPPELAFSVPATASVGALLLVAVAITVALSYRRTRAVRWSLLQLLISVAAIGLLLAAIAGNRRHSMELAKWASTLESPDAYDSYKVNRPFYIGQFEVTNEQFAAVMPNVGGGGAGPDFPVTSVSYDQALEFCQRVSARTGRVVRLPTYLEWKFASKRMDPYPCEPQTILRRAWCAPNSGGHAHPVGTLDPDSLGLFDIHGNVMEFCSIPDVTPQTPRGQLGPITVGGSYASDPQRCCGPGGHRGDLGGPTVGFRVLVEPANAGAGG